MKTILNKFIICISVFAFLSCSDSNENLDLELSIQNKVALLESGEWLLKGFEDRVMYTFANGDRSTYYGTDSVFSGAIPGTNDYTITGDFLTIDFNFGNLGTYDLKFSCENNIVDFYVNGQLNSTLYHRGSGYEQCL